MATGTTSVTLQPGASPMRVTDVYSGQPVVINNLSNVTVQASENQAGLNFVTIKAFSSARWTKAGPLYLALASTETDPGSVSVSSEIVDIAPSPVDIAVATALELFASGVPSIDVPVVLSSAPVTPIAIAGSFQTAPIDCQRYSSFVSWWGWDVGNDDLFKIGLHWQDSDGNIFERDTFYISDQNGSLITQFRGCHISGPVRGPFLMITGESQASIAGDYTYSIMGSLRAREYIRAYEEPSSDLVIYNSGQIVPGGGAGVSLSGVLPLFSGPAILTLITIGAGGQTVRFQLREQFTGSYLYDKTHTIAGVGVTDGEITELFLPRIPCDYTVINGGANALNGFRMTLVAREA